MAINTVAELKAAVLENWEETFDIVESCERIYTEIVNQNDELESKDEDDYDSPEAYDIADATYNTVVSKISLFNLILNMTAE